MSKKGGKSTPNKGEKGDKTRTTPTNELVPGILDNEEWFSKKKLLGRAGRLSWTQRRYKYFQRSRWPEFLLPCFLFHSFQPMLCRFLDQLVVLMIQKSAPVWMNQIKNMGAKILLILSVVEVAWCDGPSSFIQLDHWTVFLKKLFFENS